LVEYGSKHLSNTELIAILLRTGSTGENVISLSSRLLTKFGGLAGLGKAAFAELCGERGLSEAKACQLLAALELGRRFISLAPEERIVSTTQDAANLVTGEMGTLDQEHLRVILLNTRNEVLSTHEVYVGNVNSSVVRPAEVFRPAVRNNAPSLIVAHNHPSGNPAPSDDDIAITEDLVAAGKLLGIDVLDHLIVGSGQRYVSMNETGQGFG
jgi:DNA repair protein RadC